MSAVGIAPQILENGKEVRRSVLIEGRPLSSVGATRRRPLSASLLEFDLLRSGEGGSLDERLFQQRAELKIAISQISMHFSDAWRCSLFKQIDILFEGEDWEEGESNFMDASAFRTFLRFIVFSNPTKLPGLAIAPNGNPVASWVEGNNRAHVEFLSKDFSSAVLAKFTERGPEAVSWRGPVTNLRLFVVGFGLQSILGW